MWWPWHKHKKEIAALEKLRLVLAASGSKLTAAIAGQPQARMMMGTPNTLDTEIAALVVQVQQNVTVEGSATILINSIPTLIANAVATATAAGATPAELKSITDLGTALSNAAAPLVAALTANTPAARKVLSGPSKP